MITETIDHRAALIEVATSQLTVHSKQSEYSPEMSAKKWRSFLAGIAKEGILLPLVVTKGFRVIDGKHRLKAAKELGIENVRVIVEEIGEDEIPAFITESKLNRDDLKPGQKAALIIRLYYEEERQKAGGRSGTRTDLVPNLAQGSEETGKTNEILAKKAGVGKSNMAYLIAVYRNRPDLFELVFEGSYSVNKAYTQMKADEQPDEPTEEATVTLDARKLVAETLERNSSAPRYDDSLPASDPHNVVVDMREQVMSMTNEVLHRSKTINATKGDVKKSAREQLMALTRSCVIALGETSEKDDDSEILYVCLELLQKLEGGDK